MDTHTVRPPALRPGDCVGIIAPAGPLKERDTFERAVATLRRLGFSIRFDERIFQSWRYLAGEDRARADELQCYFDDPDIRAIVPLRGGFGSSRLIPLLNAERLQPHCKLFMGFSDLTTLHLFFQRRFGWITIHGPMASSAALADLCGDAEAHLVSLWTDPNYMPRLSFPQMECWFPGAAEGRLVGGCLSLVTSSLSTPYEIATEREILFLEDCCEPPYRIDRMLTQLRLAGKLDHIAGVLLGGFPGCTADAEGCSVEETLREVLCALKVPILANFPAGHGSENWPLPLGVRVRIDADNSCVEFLEAAVSCPANAPAQNRYSAL